MRPMDHGLRTHLTRITLVVLVWTCVSFAGCAIVPQREYDDFKPMPHDARVMNNVKLTWEVREDVGEYCAKSQIKRNNLQAVQPLACATWSAATNECKITTGPNPNHLVLGHEVRHCFEGHFHP
jgi:hypothetical protein